MIGNCIPEGFNNPGVGLRIVINSEYLNVSPDSVGAN